MNIKIHDGVLYCGLPSPSLIFPYLLNAKPKVKIIDKKANNKTGVVKIEVTQYINLAAKSIDSAE